MTPLLFLLSLLSLSACYSPHAAQQKPPPPATVENAKKESDLTTIKLTPEAEKRLGISTTVIESRDVPRTLDLSGEVVIPQGQTLIISAPMAGTLQAPADGTTPSAGIFAQKGQTLFRLSPFLAPERDLRVQLERDVATLSERVAAARLRKERAELLAREKAGSVRAAEQTQEELAVAEAELKGARERLERFSNGSLSSDFNVAISAPMSGVIQKVNAGPGQSVASGSALFEIASLSTVWVRVPVYVGDMSSVARNQAARIHSLNAEPGALSRAAKPISAPPSADATAATADLYYAISNNDGSLRPGQRVGVTLAMKLQEQSPVVPWSAVLHDVQGGTWVYENSAPQTFVRRPVEVRRITDGLAVLGRAPATGTKIVTTGAAELFSTEFSTGK
ncbi:MAG: efflux RND transporter periplasmic adaptor subunit [Acidobacteria bacterium]|nr:efflux RND transporter periplasmic adaptor subunit [Acidobacteriota bacterium]